MGDKIVELCTDPIGSLLWLLEMTVAPCLRDLANVLWEKSIFGHWVRRDNTIWHGGKAEGKCIVRMVKWVKKGEY